MILPAMKRSCISFIVSAGERHESSWCLADLANSNQLLVSEQVFAMSKKEQMQEGCKEVFVFK